MVFVETPDPGSWQDSPCETKGVTPKGPYTFDIRTMIPFFWIPSPFF